MGSTTRRRVTKTERKLLVKVCIERLLEGYRFLSSSAITACVKQYRLLVPSFWRDEAVEVQQRLSNLSGLLLALSRTGSLFQTCTVMCIIDRSLRRNETGCNRHAILECGLSWLRNALSLPMIQFSQNDILQGRKCANLQRDYKTLFNEGNLISNKGEVGRSPKFAAKALIAVLEAQLTVLKEESPELSHLCGEALSLCSVLDFLLAPTQRCLDAVIAAQDARGLYKEDTASHIRPERLVIFILDCGWGENPDFVCGTSKRDEDASEAFLVSRVAVALQYDKIKEAAALILSRGKESFWTSTLSGHSRSDSADHPLNKMAREVVQSCLLILKRTIGRKEELSKEFVNHALYIILSMNWLQACKSCSPSSHDMPVHTNNLIVNVCNTAALHETALAWNDLLDERSDIAYTSLLKYALNVISCISRCVYICKKNKFHMCKECYLREDAYDCGSSVCNLQKDKASVREERAKLRKRRKSQTTTSEAVTRSFKELEAFASQLHLLDAVKWCKDAAKRLESKSGAEENKAKKMK